LFCGVDQNSSALGTNAASTARREQDRVDVAKAYRPVMKGSDLGGGMVSAGVSGTVREISQRTQKKFRV
jgi:hypothetical protein